MLGQLQRVMSNEFRSEGMFLKSLASMMEESENQNPVFI